MIGENVTGKLDGIVLTAFRIFCTKRNCQTSGEGVRAMIRELPEFKELSVPSEMTNPALSVNQPTPSGRLAQDE